MFFGVDARDEGSHCILESGKFGSNGWCYTAEDASTWGSCEQGCPLHGSTAKVAEKIEGLANAVVKLKDRIVAAKAAKAANADLNTQEALLQQNETLLQRGRNNEHGPIEWIRSWLTNDKANDDLNASAQLAVSGGSNSTVKGQVVAIPLESQLLQESHDPRARRNSSAMELADQKKKVHHKGHKVSGAVVEVKLQSQLLQQTSTPKLKEGKTSLIRASKKRKAVQSGNSSKSQRGIVVVKLQSQL